MPDVLEPRLDDPRLIEATPEAFATGLRRYVDRVAGALGVGLESCALDPNPPASVYIALDTRLSRFPDRDLALLWDERFGWSAAVETHSGEDLIVVTYRGGDLLPHPADMAVFVARLGTDRQARQRTPQAADADAHRAMVRRLSDLSSGW